MTPEEIIAQLKEINFETLSDDQLSKLSQTLRSASSEITKIAYFRARQNSNSDPDIMGAD